MASNSFTRLTAEELQFLVMEAPSVPMDIVSTQVYGAGRLSTPDGGVDLAAYRELIGAMLQRMPRFRKKLKWIPYADIPVWVDDPAFSIDYHIRHTALPRPGSPQQLKKLTARIAGRALDRDRPLWEIWLVEGLEQGGYAIISKIHHAMLSAVDAPSLATVLMSKEPVPKVPPLRPFVPSKPPSEVSLLWDEWQRRYSMPIDALRNAGEMLLRTRGARSELERRVGAMKHSWTSIIRRPRATPVNGELSGQRRVEWLDLPLAPLLRARRMLVCSLSDVLIALLGGGVRAIYRERDIAPPGGAFRVAVPVYLAASDPEGGRSATWLLDLCIDEPSPSARLNHIAAQSADMDGEESEFSVERMMNPTRWAAPGFLSLFSTGKQLCANTLMAPIAGPQAPLYSMGAKMLGIYPHVPLQPGIGLTTGLMSYHGKMCWSFNADYDLVPDLDVVPSGVAQAFDQLMEELGIDAAAGR